MDVTIIGAGNMARGIATRAIAAGKSVELVHADPDKVGALAAELAEAAGDGAVGENVVGTAALGSSITGGIVVLAVPYEAVPDVVRAIGDGLSGKVVVDIVNPVEWPAMERLLTPPGTSSAEETAALVPAGTPVVKAFNTTFAGTLIAGQVAGLPPDVFVAADDPAAKQAVTDLVVASGLNAVDVGYLRSARELEAMQLLHIRLQRTLGLGYKSSLKLLT